MIAPVMGEEGKSLSRFRPKSIKKRQFLSRSITLLTDSLKTKKKICGK